jgi:hypothetical protein
MTPSNRLLDAPTASDVSKCGNDQSRFQGMKTAKSGVKADFAALKPGVPECPSRWMDTRYR